ncbi:hypothetical protein EYF80_022477 [Liparis tanakae]|uniref:Uncharacterized protein n=1 Tax=Liparis tanakae TaxID=230148 RepID=A0A4Z2HP59_9TELE|nr:hypothetical protein EYF80_022477 [Liparis tanakae]
MISGVFTARSCNQQLSVPPPVKDGAQVSAGGQHGEAFEEPPAGGKTQSRGEWGRGGGRNLQVIKEERVTEVSLSTRPRSLSFSHPLNAVLRPPLPNDLDQRRELMKMWIGSSVSDN